MRLVPVYPIRQHSYKIQKQQQNNPIEKFPLMEHLSLSLKESKWELRQQNNQNS